jgi:hypothetical protein
MKKQGFFINISESEISQLRQLAADRDMSMTNLLRLCIQLLWMEKEMESDLKGGKPPQLIIDGEPYTINVGELAVFADEMAKIAFISGLLGVWLHKTFACSSELRTLISKKCSKPNAQAFFDESSGT